MKANPGGNISPEDVVGRDDLIAELWRVLGRQSLVLTAERRMGKTCIIKKMRAEPLSDVLPYFHDLEKVNTSLEFAELVFRDVEHALSGSSRLATRTRQLLGQLSGAEFQGAKFPTVAAPHWKDLLSKIMQDLEEHQDKTVIFFWDELPWMLSNIKNAQGERAAMEVLDTLRALRQTHPRLRMVFTGSVGLHHVIGQLKKQGYGNAPVNDMHTKDVPHLSSETGQELALLLLQGEGIEATDPNAAAKTIADAVDNNAFYIHSVVDDLKVSGVLAEAEAIEAVVSQAIRDGAERWHLSHYLERVTIYYGEDAGLVLQLLDILAATSAPLRFDELFNRLQSQREDADAEKTRAILKLLRLDHYIARDEEGAYLFRTPLIQRWWRFERGLMP